MKMIKSSKSFAVWLIVVLIAAAIIAAIVVYFYMHGNLRD